MGKITSEQKEKMYYRQLILHDKMLYLESLISGKGQSYLPLILGEDGKTSPEKLDAFISGLLESFDHYIELDPDRTADDNTREMYRRFLYCTIMSLKGKRNRRCPSAVYMAYFKTYEDLIEASKWVDLPDFDSYHDFLMDWYERYRDDFEVFPDDDSVFVDGVVATLQFDGFSAFFDWLPHDIRIQICKDYAKENNISDSENAEYLEHLEDPAKYWKEDSERENEWIDEFLKNNPEDSEASEALVEKMAAEYEEEHKDDKTVFKALDSLGEAGSYDDNEILRNLSPEQREEYEHRKADYDMMGDAVPFVLDKLLIDGLELINKFYEFVKLYYETDHSHFCDDITNMVETYLFEHKISAFSFGDYYGLITYQIDKAQSRVESEMERVRYK